MSWRARLCRTMLTPFLAVALVASGCGPDSDAADKSDQGSLPALNAQELVLEELSAAQQDLAGVSYARMNSSGFAELFREDQVGCLSGAVAGTFSDERINELALDSLESLPLDGGDGPALDDAVLGGFQKIQEVSSVEESDLAAKALECADWRGAVADTLEEAGVSAEEADCVAPDLPEGMVQSLALQSLVSEYQYGIGLTDSEMLELLKACGDLKSKVVDALTLDNGVSQDGALCMFQGLPDWLLGAVLGLGSTSDLPEGAAEEIVQLEQRCLSADELAALTAAAEAAVPAVAPVPDVAPPPEDITIVVSEDIAPSGHVIDSGIVSVSAPSGAFDAPAKATVREPIGEFGFEVGGAVVQIDHQGLVLAPVTVTWDVSQLNEQQQALVLLVRWDEKTSGWAPEDVDYEISDGVLTADIQQWSAWSWVTTRAKRAGQKTLEAAKQVGSGVLKGAKQVGSKALEITEPVQEGAKQVGSAIWEGAKQVGSATWEGTKQVGSATWEGTKSAVEWMTDIENRFKDSRNLMQTTFELLGRRVDAPKCSSEALPTWISSATTPEEESGLRDVPIRLCYEKGPGDAVTMRAANNRPYTQFIYVDPTDSHNGSALDIDEISINILVQWAAHEVLSLLYRDRLYSPALKQVFTDINQPGADSPNTIKFHNGVNVFTIIIDVVAFAISVIEIAKLGGKIAEWIQRLFEVMFGCLGRTLSAHLTQLAFPANPTIDGLKEIAHTGIDIIKECAETLQLDSIILNLIEELPQAYIQQAKRLHKLFIKAFKFIKIAEFVALVSDHLLYGFAYGQKSWQINTKKQPPQPEAQSQKPEPTPEPSKQRPEPQPSRSQASEELAPSRQLTAITAGEDHTCGIRTDGTIDCWGDNSSGEADAPSGTFTAITAGEDHTCGIRTDGTIDCWGDNSSGEADAPSGTFTAITAGWGHTCALAYSGEVSCWGAETSRSGLVDWGQADAPEGAFTAITAGWGHTCGIRTDGTIDCWGLHADAPEGTFTAIASGWDHTCGIRTGGAIACWGTVKNAPEGTFTAIASGWNRACALTSTGEAVCWDSDGSHEADTPEGPFTAITAGSDHTCGIRTDKTSVCWDQGGVQISESDSGEESPAASRNNRQISSL